MHLCSIRHYILKLKASVRDTGRRQEMIETCTVKSKALHSDVTCKVIIPQKIEIHKVLILLHGNIYPEGAFFLIENLPEELSLEELCEKYHMMVIIPYMKSIKK